MYRSKPLTLGVLACFLVAGLEACVNMPQALSPKAESSLQTQHPKSEHAGQTTNDEAGVPATSPTFTTPLNEQTTPSDPSPPAQCEKKELKATLGVLAEDSSCFKFNPGAKKKGRGGGRCEPQSLPYARCRSGINSCKLGKENSPLTWFFCEQKAGNTSDHPKSGSVLILGSTSKHKMKTGHVMYVESVSPLTTSTSKLILSHTNYDRKCSKETKIEATYNLPTMTIDIHTGAWKAWGGNLKVAGFILR